MQVYLVGGAVRDALLNRKVVERDYVVVGATPEEMLSQGFTQVGKDFQWHSHDRFTPPETQYRQWLDSLLSSCQKACPEQFQIWMRQKQKNEPGWSLDPVNQPSRDVFDWCGTMA